MKSAVGSSRNVFVPLMVTGGFRLKKAMDQVLVSGAVNLIGQGRLMWVMQAKLMKARRR